MKCKNCKNMYKQIPSETIGTCQKKITGAMMKKIVFDNDYCYDDFDGINEQSQYEKDYEDALKEIL